MSPRTSWKLATLLIIVVIGIGAPSICGAQNSGDVFPPAQSGIDNQSSNTKEPIRVGGSYLAYQELDYNKPTSNDSGNSQPSFSGQLLTQNSIIASKVQATNQAATANQGLATDTIGQANLIGDENLVTGNLYGAFDFMFLKRTGPSPQLLAVTDGVPSLNSADFSYDHRFAPGVTFGIGDQFGYGLEFHYFNSTHEFDDVIAGTAVVPIFFGGIPATAVPSYDIFAKTSTNNYELNQWVQLNGRTRLGLGLRIIDMREEYNITETGTNSGFFCITDNELFGGQFAGQYIVFANDISTVYVQGKAGLYYNRAKVQATSLNAVINPDSDELSYAGDLRLVVDLPVTDIFSFRFGYHATLMTNIAQALDQNDDLSIFTPADPGDFDLSSVWFTGGFFGLVGHY